MKLVATTDFFNAKCLDVKVPTDAENFRHANVIHTGLRFSIGTSDNYEELQGSQKEYVGLLLSRKLAVIDDKTNNENGVIKAIDARAKQEFAAHKKAIEKQPTQAEMIAAAVTAALAGAKKAA